jgi:hypothetical protein
MVKRRAKSQIGSLTPTTKSQESTWFPCVQVACNIQLKSSQRGLQLCLDLTSIGGMHAKLWASKLWESQLWQFRNSHLGVLGQNAIWMWASWRGTEYTMRGKVVASPKSGPWWVLWVWICSSLVLAPKVFQLCTNHLVLVLCKSVWVVETCQFFLVPSRSSSTPFYLSKCCEPGNVPWLLGLPMFSIWDSHLESIKELGARHSFT